MKVTMVIGPPAVGKSRLMRCILDRLAPTTFYKIPYVMWHQSIDGTRVLGDYTDLIHKYPGTDRMSMACQPHVIQWMLRAHDAGCRHVIFEGDRLGNDKMIKSLQYISDLEVVRLMSSRLATRRLQRPEQDEKFQRSRDTKIANMIGPEGRLARTRHPLRTMLSDYPVDTEHTANWILAR